MQSRLVVKTSLKLLIVFVEYSESNSPRFISAVNTVDTRRGSLLYSSSHFHSHSLTNLNTHSHKCCVAGVKPWSYLMEVLEEKNGSDTELLIYAMTLINKVTHTDTPAQNTHIRHTAADLMCQLYACVCVRVR